jgi:hypothetical protein
VLATALTHIIMIPLVSVFILASLLHRSNYTS